ncbi:MAG: aminotransferase class V-fold PLP-dependent enzyme [Terrimicrobiaceae bacterium]
MSRTIYLDNNATTQVDPAAFEAMLPWLKDEYGNPSSAYALGRRAADAIEVARRQVAALVGSAPEEILFTSCGTESINTAILSCIALDPDKKHIITSAVEHSATVKLCEHLDKRGYEITWLPVDSRGQLDPQSVAAAITDETAVVSLLWANNETGVLFPVEEIATITASKKVPLHVDAVQAAGKVPMNLKNLGAQFVSFSGHKIHAAKGVGALAVSHRLRFTPQLRGSQEENRRGGTQNVASIVGFGQAAEIAMQQTDHTGIQSLRDRFEEHLLQNIPGVEVNGDRHNRLPNTSNLAFEGLESEGALILLGEKGVCCSAGSACTSGSVHPSHVLRAMGFSNDRARASLRFSFGRLNTEEDLQDACEIIPGVIKKLRSLKTTGSPVAVAA